MSSKPFMNQNDVIRFAALMEGFIAFSKNKYSENWQTVFNQRCDQYGSEEMYRLTNLASFYTDCIRTEISYMRDQAARGEITTGQFKLALDFTKREYAETLAVDRVEEIEWRFQCLKERAIPTTIPFADVLEQRRIDELNRKIRQSKGKE